MSTKPTIYLHIGAGKTGSTTIQVWLKSVESELAHSGYLVFDTKFEPGVRHDLLSNQQEYFHDVLKKGTSGVESFQAQFRKNLTYMQEHGFHSAVMSAENLFNHWTNAHTWFTPFIDECNWKIIAYVRNQPYYIISAWKEWGYWRQDFEELLAGELHANWTKALAAWDTTFGRNNIYLGILEKSCLVDGLLHHDFAVAINTPHIIANDQKLVYANPSINNRSAVLFSKIRHEYLQRNPQAKSINDIIPTDSTETRIQRILAHNAKLNEMFHFKPLVVRHAPVSGTQEYDSPLSLVNQTMLDRIHEMFAESNRELLQRYRPDISPEVAFPRITTTETRTFSDHELYLHGFHIAFESLNSTYASIDMLEDQLKAKIKQLHQLQQQINTLESQVAGLMKSHKNIGFVWQSTVEHTKAIAHLQSQIDQLYALINRPFRNLQRILDWIKHQFQHFSSKR